MPNAPSTQDPSLEQLNTVREVGLTGEPISRPATRTAEHAGEPVDMNRRFGD